MLLRVGLESSPRRNPTLELLNDSFGPIWTGYPAIAAPARKLNYAFMYAEAAWIMSGRNDLDFIAKYCNNIRQYSDNGKTMTGAYGPHVVSQYKYVVKTLVEDPHSRQAVMTIWTPRPERSRDIPCTVSLQFFVRDKHLYAIVNMRSNDVWLGLPYDFFVFWHIARGIIAELQQVVMYLHSVPIVVINAGSRHLYKANRPAVEALLETPMQEGLIVELPSVDYSSWDTITNGLIAGAEALRTSSR